MNIAQKLSLIKSTKVEIIQGPEQKYRKLKDLLLFCSDPRDIDVVIKALKALCDVFCDILPSYRIREEKKEANEDATGEGKDGEKKKQNHQQRVSKEVQSMRD